MRQRVTDARVATLATVTVDGRPHAVPCCFAVDGDVLYTGVDDVKPKSTLALRRLDNVRAHPAASLLVDHYDDADWSTLWWVRVDGLARVVDRGSPERDAGHALLVAKYDQYRRQPPSGPVIAIDIERWRAWP